MYNKIGAVTAVGATGGLAQTGLSVIWLVLAGFAFIAAGAALARIAPRFSRRTEG